MSESIIWENDAHKNYDHERDAWYLVRTPADDHYPGSEWIIVGNERSPEKAIAWAEKYAEENPSAPVRVERFTLKPDEGITISSLNIINPVQVPES